MRAPARLARLTFACACVAVAVLCAPATAVAKSYTMPRVAIEAVVAPDGSLAVSEQRTYSFSGDYTRVYWDLEPPAGGAVTGVSVQGPDGRVMPPATSDGRPPGFSRVTPQQGAITRVEAYDTMSDTTVTFTLSYTVTRAAVRWADTSELYWQAVTANWDTGASDVEVVVHLPASVVASDVLVWAHGPLTGSIHVQPDASVVAKVAELPANTMLEPRILFPAAALSAAPVDPSPRRAAVLAEEKANVDAANAAREQARREEAQAAAELRIAVVVATVLGFALPALLLAAAATLWFLYGREYRPMEQVLYFREPPADLNPAVVGYLWRMGGVETTDMAACLMDLADRGVIRMEPATAVHERLLLGDEQVPTYLLTLDTSTWATLPRLDQKLLSFLFTTMAGDTTLTLDELKTAAKARAQEYQDGVNAFKAAVSDQADGMGLVEKGSRVAFGFGIASVVLAVIVTVTAAAVSSSPWVLAFGLVCSGVALVFALNTKRRSHAAAELYEKYRGLRDYLRDFSRLREAPPASVVLWNKFLVLAVVFGIAETVIEQLKIVAPQVVTDPAFATTYWWVGSHDMGAAPIAALSEGFTSAASIASSELSSSSGGGGGFSGGGGGGFGGGGGGGAD